MHVGTSSADAYRMAARLGAAGKNLKRQLDRAGREAASVMIGAITDPASTAKYIPENFELRLQGSLQSKTEVRLAQARTVTVIIWAMGKRYKRHLPAMNEGRLRRPVYGRTRRIKDGSKSPHQDRIRGGLYYNPWTEQRIRPGLIDDPKNAAIPKAVQKYRDAARRVKEQIERG